MSKPNAFVPLTTLAPLPGAAAQDGSGRLAETGAEEASDFAFSAQVPSSGTQAPVPGADVWADIAAVPSAVLPAGGDGVPTLGLPALAELAVPAPAVPQAGGGRTPLLTPRDPVFGAAVLDPFGLADVGASAKPTFADIDGDGDLDAFVGNGDGNALYFANTGSASAPAFQPAITNPFGLATVGGFAAPAFADIDGDGDFDAFVGSRLGDVLFFSNTGSANAPAFQAATANPFGLSDVGYFAAPAFADIDADGDLDAFIGENGGGVRFFRNDGNAGAPAFAAPVDNPFGLTDVGNSATPTFADIDGDGDLDLAVANSVGNTGFFRNTGSSTAPAFTAAGNNFGLGNVGSFAAPAFADLDGDGDFDALVGNANGQVSLFQNNVPGVSVTQSGGSTATTEGGATDSYSVVLRTQPTANVTVTLDDTNGQVGTSATTLVFTPDNWNVAQTVTVTATDDALGEGRHTGVIRHTTSSADAAYNGLIVSPVRVAVGDDDLTQAAPSFGASTDNPFGLPDVGSYASPTFADIDGDGDLDAIVGTLNNGVRFFSNVGTTAEPMFRPAGSDFGLTTGVLANKPTLADIDGDGDLDAFVGDGNGDTFFRNTGSASAPAFTAEGSNRFGLPDVGYYAAPTFADIDADGDLDAFIGNTDGITAFFRNVGGASAPAFVDAGTNLGLGDVGVRASPTFADIDGDGDLDGFIGQIYGETLFFRNTGSASAPAFTDAGPILALPTSVFAASPSFADLDADGDFDAFVGGTDGIVRSFLNSAVPNVIVTPTGGSTQVREGGALDSYFVVLSAAPSANVTIAIAPTNGQLNVSESSLVFTPTNWNVAREVTVTASDDSVGEGSHGGVIRHTVLGRGTAYEGVVAPPVRVGIADDDLPQADPLYRPTQTNPFNLTRVDDFLVTPTFVDIDGDGDLDAFAGGSNGNSSFFRNSGTAEAPRFDAKLSNPFGLPAQAGPPGTGSFNIALADIDGDGDLDAFFGKADGSTLFLRNTGSASQPAFTTGVSNAFGLTDVGQSAIAAFADIDADGDLDAFIGGGDGTTQFFRNTGSLHAPAFTAEGSNFGLLDIGDPAHPTFTDFDGDGDLDAFVGNNLGVNRLFRNTGSANAPAFTDEGTVLFGLSDPGTLAAPSFADIDGDGDIDAFLGNAAGDTLIALNTRTFVLEAPGSIRYTDTAFDDSFATVSGTLATRGESAASLRFGINGNDVANPVGAVAKTTAYGVLTVNTTSGAYSFVPNDAGIEALGTNLSLAFQVTATNGRRTEGSTLTVNFAQSGTTETAGNDTLTGTTAPDRMNGLGGHDSLSGADGNDSLVGGEGNDTLNGGNGNDLLDGGNGTDSLIGGTGNDSYVVGSSTDRISETSTLAAEIDSVSASVTWTLGANLERLTLSGTISINGTGNTLANTITGNTGNNSLVGADGNDTLSGGNGNDTLNGGNGNDSMVGGTGNDTYVVNLSTDRINETSTLTTEIDSVSSSLTWTLGDNLEALTLTGNGAINGTGNAASNTITGNTGNNSLSGVGGDDSLLGGDGNDTLSGGHDDDLLDGGNGTDSLIGGAGNDTYVVNLGTDRISETTTLAGEIDSVISSLTWTLGTNLEKLSLTGTGAINGTGNTLANTITGNAGINLLTGGGGNDTLDGGAGNDNLSGNAGLDVFRFASPLGNSNVDRISDFNVVDDRLQLENSVFTKLTTTGVLSASNFRASTTGNAADSNDFVLYDTDSGQLFYDADGSGTGAKVLVATLITLPVLSSAEIFVT